MERSIILIGPNRAGKRTVGKLLADRLGLPFYDLSEDSDRYHNEHGIVWDDVHRAWEEQGFAGWYRFLRPYDAKAVARGVAEHPGSVIKLGALQATYEDQALRAEVAQALHGHDVVLLLPSQDVEQSARVLEQRQAITYQGQEISEYFVRHPANRALARHIVYTYGRTPAQTVEDVQALLDPSDETVVLIGPMNAGKSTTADPLAERLGRGRLAMDEVRWDYYKERGWTLEEQRRIAEEQGLEAMLRYWKPFEIHAVERVMAEHMGKVIDFGAGHSVYDDPQHMARAHAALEKHPNVVLLLPSPDPDESIAILRERTAHRIDGVDLNRYLLERLELRELATMTVYTEGKTPQETASDILATLAG